jgi:signal transduction histidine kinase
MTGSDQEILEIPPLSAGETSLLNMHSVLNVLNVLYGELTLLGFALTDDGNLLDPALTACERFRAALPDPAKSLAEAAALGAFVGSIRRNLTEELARHPAARENAAVAESMANIEAVFAILAVRARELLARARAPMAWVEIGIAELQADFRTVFAAIEKHSRGRYRIIYNLAQQEPSDYYIDFVIESPNGRTISLPPVFIDVMRDLLANARKYTPPGGTINAGLYETADQLRFTVQDTGSGIPPAELATVVHYGKRGSNVSAVRTMGGGFGLTKAFLVTKQFGGRFWINSELGIGTRIRIEIPRPVAGA